MSSPAPATTTRGSSTPRLDSAPPTPAAGSSPPTTRHAGDLAKGNTPAPSDKPEDEQADQDDEAHGAHRGASVISRGPVGEAHGAGRGGQGHRQEIALVALGLEWVAIDRDLPVAAVLPRPHQATPSADR